MTPERVWRAVTDGDDGATEANAPFGPAAASRLPARPMTERFAAPLALADALALLAADDAARPVAGGTDLVVAARQGRKSLPSSIVAIDRIAELDATTSSTARWSSAP